MLVYFIYRKIFFQHLIFENLSIYPFCYIIDQRDMKKDFASPLFTNSFTTQKNDKIVRMRKMALANADL